MFYKQRRLPHSGSSMSDRFMNRWSVRLKRKSLSLRSTSSEPTSSSSLSFNKHKKKDSSSLDRRRIGFAKLRCLWKGGTDEDTLTQTTDITSEISSCSGSSSRKRIPSSLVVRCVEKVHEKKFNAQRIAIIGSGAVGSYFGARLWEAGHSVKFLFRGGALEKVRRDGLYVNSIMGDIHIDREQVEAFSSTEEMGKVDWIIIAVKSTSLDAVPDLLAPLLSPSTRVLVLMNGLVEKDLICMIKAKMGEDVTSKEPLQCCQALYGGMVLFGSCRKGPGEIEHTLGGSFSAGVACSRSLRVKEDHDALGMLMKGSQIETIFEDSLLRGRWKKYICNVSINGISVALGGLNVGEILAVPGRRALASTIMDETIAVANADLEQMYGRGNFEALGEADKLCILNLMDRLHSFQTSTTLDLIHGRPMEIRYLFKEPVERAKRLGIPVPHMEAILAQIEIVEKSHRHVKV